MRFELGESIGVSPLGDTRVNKAVQLIEGRISDAQLTITGLARELEISPSRLRQIFAAELGVAPKRYIRECKLTRAATMLSSSRLSVKEVMAASGFNDPSHFAREFKKRFGAAPSARRKCFDVLLCAINRI